MGYVSFEKFKENSRKTIEELENLIFGELPEKKETEKLQLSDINIDNEIDYADYLAQNLS